MKQTKAERIYDRTMARIRNEIKATQQITRFAVSEFACDENETVSARTVNEIERINSRKKELYAIDVLRLGLERNPVQEQAFRNMDLTIKLWRKNDKEFKDMINS